MRQQLLILHLRSADLASDTVAWALYDGALPSSHVQMQSGDQTEPPYESVLAAMRDGWRVIQLGSLPERSAAAGMGQLVNEYVLERMVDVTGQQHS